MLTTWMGDMITERGIGNGISMIIFAGIVARIPVGLQSLWTQYFVGVTGADLWQPILFAVALLDCCFSHCHLGDVGSTS